MSGFGLPIEEFAEQRALMKGLPTDVPLDEAIHEIVAPDIDPEESDPDHPLAGLPPECIERAVDLMTTRAVGYSAYWASMSAEETASRAK